MSPRIRCFRLFRSQSRAFKHGWPLLLVFGLAGVLLTHATAEPTSSQTAPQYPNLKNQPPADLQFDRETIDGTSQYVLRFSNTAWNSGTGPLHLVPVNSGSRTTVWQYVFASTTASGSPVEQHNVGEAEFHPEHNHWHFQDFAKYELYTKADWQNQTGVKRGQGTKTTFCIIDYLRITGSQSA